MTAASHLDLSRAAWRKSRRSNNGGNCVEVAAATSAVAVRDSKNPHGPALVTTHHAWQAFTAQLKVGTRS